MVDRIAALEAEKATLETHIVSSPPSKTTPASTNPNDPGVAQLRLDLAEALRSKGVTEARLRSSDEELTKLKAKSKEDAHRIKTLSSERTMLVTRLKDREHELREKHKLLEQVQDEMITLNLQMSVAETERDKVKVENKELVDRWMKRMAQEAEAMNIANEPEFRTR
ncbi:hypothetical protein VHEMI02730 [[Torrubiella] hemipterigena]|uniref:Autophagy-related protein 16 domain-containing protein n=1 Tax=[Torrubiella] hemipterigena TaxID=1531966 RepID=A0A0A1SWN9_9HYPO|nr:hypothetical protein VHEMI02730 [[Torrubiella] hemipterigena]